MLSNEALAAVSTLIENRFARLKDWRVLSKVRTDDCPDQGLAGPHEPRSLPMPDDLHRSHPPTTSTSTPNPTHTRPVTSNFTMHTAQ